MSLSLSFALFSILFLQIPHGDAKNINISVRQYTGLKRSEIRGYESEHYFFQFCSCPKSVTEKHMDVNKCECSDPKKGKPLSVGTAKFFTSSKNCGSGCLHATINTNDKIFVKVTIDSKTLTVPEYQSLPAGDGRNEVILKTSKTSKLRLAYTTDVDDDDEFSNTVLHDAKGGATDFFSKITNQKKVEIKNTNNVKFNADVTHLHSIGSIKNFLFSKSRVDKQDPARYDISSLKEWIVSYHNVYRSKHNAPSLTADSGLAARGKRWADELAYHRGCLVHEQPRVYGENLFFFGARHLPSPQTLAAAVVQSFYIEGIGYNYSSWRPLSYFKTGHFTQLVWKNSRRIGVGVSIVKASSIRSPCVSASPNTYLIFVVVKYDPAGNFETNKAYLENVERPVA